MNDSRAAGTRRRIVDDLLEELTSWSPRERAGAFRHWLRGSLSLVHLHVLTVLEADGPLSMSKLAEALDVSVASTTGIVDRMEQRGLVERRHQPDDRRVILVHPTDAGDSVFRDLAMERRKHLAGLLDRMTDAELESFLTGLRALRRVRTEVLSEPNGHPPETGQT
ncbi:MAG TPA: MarR family transcriptional regulator [Candidatus Limnocylindrales bacterium]|nr:MarR family transcriptional regulator [Candidatus Limnocylindrales bacterium]